MIIISARNYIRSYVPYLPRDPEAGVVGIRGDGLLSTWSWFTSSDALSLREGSLLDAAAPVPVPAVPAENADDAEFGLPALLTPPPEVGVAPLRAAVAVEDPPPPPTLLVRSTGGPAAAVAPVGIPMSASAAASSLAWDQSAWATDISGVSSELTRVYAGGGWIGEGGGVVSV